MNNDTTKDNTDVIFTKRQLDVLTIWSEVAGEDMIADRMGLSKHTVHTLLRRARHRVGAKRTFDAYKYALDRGWINP
ncbi:LuxR C-terminal-related transcriptional regulator [Lewinella sp. LCG006]|uniref:LuxR C-terminal-related transcriptional regulator n=1 Tax=Lewinella sp. LCG006 TaxID=3231911 RepID=UPI00345FC295